MVSKILLLLLVVVVVASMKAEASSIRKRRDASYGDEMVTPAAGGGAQQHEMPTAVEMSAVTVASPQIAGSQSNVETSGYRRRRAIAQNSYGDESVTPMAADPQMSVPVESRAVTVEQAGGGAQSSVQSSGY